MLPTPATAALPPPPPSLVTHTGACTFFGLQKLRKWVPLTIATAEKMVPQGYLKQTCLLLAAGKPIPPEPPDDDDDDQIEIEAMPSLEEDVRPWARPGVVGTPALLGAAMFVCCG